MKASSEWCYRYFPCFNHGKHTHWIENCPIKGGNDRWPITVVILHLTKSPPQGLNHVAKTKDSLSKQMKNVNSVEMTMIFVLVLISFMPLSKFTLFSLIRILHHYQNVFPRVRFCESCLYLYSKSFEPIACFDRKVWWFGRALPSCAGRALTDGKDC